MKPVEYTDAQIEAEQETLVESQIHDYLLEQKRPLRVIVTGSRHWTDEHAVRWELEALPPGSTIVEGGNRPDDLDERRSADYLAYLIATELGLNVETHWANWVKYGKAAGPRRNTKMVDLGADKVLAFPAPDSRGTTNCMIRAKQAGIPVINCGAPVLY